jgi:hypothetical protein
MERSKPDGESKMKKYGRVDGVVVGREVDFIIKGFES